MAATDLERLVVQLSADFRSYENAMAKASGITRAQLKQIKAEAGQAGAIAATAFDGASKGVARYGTQATAAARQAGALRAQTGNLAAQFQDIAVQLQGGQSPFTIALQQGSQISQVLGGKGARGAVTALSGAFASLLSPVSLATIALIAAGGAAVQFFGSLLSDGAEAQQSLEDQAKLVRDLASEWGDAVPAIAAYADQLERAQRATELQQGGDAAIAALYGDAREQVAGLSDQLVQLRGDLELTGAPLDQISALQSAFNDLAGAIEENQATAQDAERVQAALLALIESGIGDVSAFASAFDVLAGSLARVAQDAQATRVAVSGAAGALQAFAAAEAARRGTADALGARAGFLSEQERLNGLTADQLALEREIAAVRADAAEAGVAIGSADAARIAADRLAAEAARRAPAPRAAGGGGRASAAPDIDREREAVAKLIEALAFEQSLIGLSAVEREKANQLRRAGAAATEQEREQIAAIVDATYAETEALRASEEAMERLRGLSRDVLGGLFEDLRNGASAADLLAGALNRVAENLVTAGIDGLVTGFGRPAGGLFGGRIIPGILHDGGRVGVDGYGHGRSVPASAFSGARRYHTGGVVGGLNPGEVPAILQRGETVIPRGAAGGATQVQIILSADLEGRILKTAAGQTVQLVQANNRVLPDRVQAIMNDARRRY